MINPNTVEAILETIIFCRNTIANLQDDKEHDRIEETGYYLTRIWDVEEKIVELEKQIDDELYRMGIIAKWEASIAKSKGDD